MRSLHLFAGAGGGLLADLILGHTPIAAVEWDAYACAVLRSRAADGWFPGLHVHEGDVRLFNPSEYSGRVDCIHAGFPCQDISTAGKGAGITGERSGLYTEVMRAIDAIRPAWVMLENSPAIRTRGRHVVIADLVALGYSWRDGILSAADVGAPHKRDRWWCLAKRTDAISNRSWGDKPCFDFRRNKKEPEDLQQENWQTYSDNTKQVCKVVAYPNSTGLEERERCESEQRAYPATPRDDWWSTEPDVGRLAHGVASRAHQIKCLGNGQVPIAAATAWVLLGGP